MVLPEHCNTVVVTHLGTANHIDRDVAVEVVCPSGRCCYPRLGLVALCTSDSALFLRSETVALLAVTCQRDEGKTALREGRKRMVSLGEGAFVPPNVTETTTLVSVRDARPN